MMLHDDRPAWKIRIRREGIPDESYRCIRIGSTHIVQWKPDTENNWDILRDVSGTPEECFAIMPRFFAAR